MMKQTELGQRNKDIKIIKIGISLPFKNAY